MSRIKGVTSCPAFYLDVTATGKEEMRISTEATLGRQPAEAADVDYLVAGPVGNAEKIVCVNVVAEADDRSEVTAGSADSA